MKTPRRRSATLDAGGTVAAVQHRAGDLPVAYRAAELTGRDAERRVLDRLVEAVRAGESRALVVHGEPGIGKTALLEYLGGSAPGCRIERAVGVQSEVHRAMLMLCWPVPRAHPTPPSRVHRQRDAMVRSASWVLGAWSSGAHARSAGGLLVLAHLGRTWLQEHTERPGSRKEAEKVHRISDWRNDAERTFSDHRRRTGRVLAATRQRNRPVRVLVQVSKTRRAEREVDP
jgi:hypothetical protein